jgi:dienelactone hydrolase
VLWVDDRRGVAQSEGTQKEATSADFATDVEAAIDYLKTRTDVNTAQIGLIGHSEGGPIAPIVIG